jgi:hypothetical protein
MTTLKNIVAGNSIRSPLSTSRGLYNFTLCLLVISMTVELQTSGATANATPSKLWRMHQTALPDILENAKHTTRIRSVSFDSPGHIVNHYNAKIELTGLTFDRNAEGVYAPKGSPLVLDYTKIDIHGDGWVQLVDESGPRLVEEDAQTISTLIDQKIREAELYNIEQKKDDLIGGTNTSTTDD